MMSKVKHHLINRLAKAFNEPDWPDPEFMMSQWEEVFGRYHEEQLEEAADIYIRGKFKSFPTIGHIMEIIDRHKSTRKQEKPSPVPTHLKESFDAFCAWHDFIMERSKSDIPPPNVPQYVKENIIEKTKREFRRMYPDECKGLNWRSLEALMWSKDWFVQSENEMRRLEKVNRAATKNYLKKVMAQPEAQRSVVGRMLIACMPKEIKHENN